MNSIKKTPDQPMTNTITNNITDTTDVDDVNKNTAGRPLFDNEAAGRPIIYDPLTKQLEGWSSRPKKKIKVAILQLQQFREFLWLVRCGATMKHYRFICGAALRIEREKSLDHPGVRMKIKCIRGHLYGKLNN